MFVVWRQDLGRKLRITSHSPTPCLSLLSTEVVGAPPCLVDGMSVMKLLYPGMLRTLTRSDLSPVGVLCSLFDFGVCREEGAVDCCRRLVTAKESTWIQCNNTGKNKEDRDRRIQDGHGRLAAGQHRLQWVCTRVGARRKVGMLPL